MSLAEPVSVNKKLSPALLLAQEKISNWNIGNKHQMQTVQYLDHKLK